jgi:hypothetical protein
MMFEHYYPSFNPVSDGPFGAAIPPEDQHPIRVSYPEPKLVALQLTTEIPGLSRGQAVSIDNSGVTFDATDGTQITTPWKPVYNERAFNGVPHVSFEATLDRSLFDRIRSRPVKVTVNLAVTELKADPAQDVVLKPEGQFTVADVGLCSFSPALDFGSASLDCNVPWHQPFLTHISAPVSIRPCDQPSDNDEPSHRFTDWTGALDQDPADFGLTSVWSTTIPFGGTSMYSVRTRAGVSDHPNFVCPGAKIVFARYRAVRRFRIQLAPQIINLPSPGKSDEGILSLP